MEKKRTRSKKTRRIKKSGIKGGDGHDTNEILQKIKSTASFGSATDLKYTDDKMANEIKNKRTVFDTFAYTYKQWYDQVITIDNPKDIPEYLLNSLVDRLGTLRHKMGIGQYYNGDDIYSICIKIAKMSEFTIIKRHHNKEEINPAIDAMLNLVHPSSPPAAAEKEGAERAAAEAVKTNKASFRTKLYQRIVPKKNKMINNDSVKLLIDFKAKYNITEEILYKVGEEFTLTKVNEETRCILENEKTNQHVPAHIDVYATGIMTINVWNTHNEHLKELAKQNGITLYMGIGCNLKNDKNKKGNIIGYVGGNYVIINFYNNSNNKNSYKVKDIKDLEFITDENNR